MITPDLMKRAIETAGEHCDDTCHHSDALKEIKELAQSHIFSTAMAGMANGISPSLILFSEGIHVGYRLRELETETPTQPSTIN